MTIYSPLASQNALEEDEDRITQQNLRLLEEEVDEEEDQENKSVLSPSNFRVFLLGCTLVILLILVLYAVVIFIAKSEYGWRVVVVAVD